VEKIWLKEYPPGVPAEIDLNEFTSVKDILEKSCQRFADSPAYSNMGVTLRYRDIDRLSRRDIDRLSRDFAAFLQGLGLGKRDRVAIMMPNVLQYPVALFGVLRAGMVVVNVNPLYTPRELEHQLNDSGAAVIVIVENFAHTLQQVLDKTMVKTVVMTQLGDLFPFPKRTLVNFVVKHLKKRVPAWKIPAAVPFRRALRAGAGQALTDVPLNRDDLAFLQEPRRSRVPTVHRWYHWCLQGRHADPWQPGGEPAGLGLVEFSVHTGQGNHCDCLAAVSHFFVDC